MLQTARKIENTNTYTVAEGSDVYEEAQTKATALKCRTASISAERESSVTQY